MPSRQRPLTVALCAVLVAWAPARPLAAVKRVAAAESASANKAPAGQGRVTFVTDRRAYLDHGADVALTAGQTVTLFRSDRAAGSCVVDTVAAHGASCTGGRARVGDTFRFARAARPSPSSPSPSPSRERAPVLAAEALQADAQTIADATIQKVEFVGRARFGAPQAVALTGGYASWTTGAPQSDFRQERVDGTVRLRLGETGLRFDAAFSALRWQPRPDSTRFSPGRQTQFFLWEAEISRRDPDARTVVAVGRLWPWHTPGLSVLDGIQIGRQNEARTREWGAYAGLIPDGLSLAPAVDVWAGGLYGSLTQVGTKSGLVHLAREEARIGARHLPDVGLVTEAELLAQVWLGSSTVGGGGRVIFLPGGTDRAALDRGYVHLRGRVLSSLVAGLHVRYFGAALDGGQTLLRNVSPTVQGGYHTGGDAHWDPLPWLGTSLFADLNRDTQSGLTGRDGGVELRFPRLLGDRGGLWLGAEAAEGWLRSRSLHAQVLVRLRERFRVLGRVTAMASEFLTPQSNLNTEELDGYLQIDASIWSWLRLGGRALIRAPLDFVADAPATGPGLVLNLDATGIF